MDLKKINKKVKCDIGGCKNIAKYYFETKKIFIAGGLFICSDCLKKMYELMAKEIVPAGIKNVYKKSNEIKEK